MKSAEPLDRSEAERRYAGFQDLGRRRRTRRRAIQVSATVLSVVVVGATFLWAAAGFSGLRQEQPASTIHPVGIAASGYTTCAVSASGGVECWGSNGGQFGTANPRKSARPRPVPGLPSNIVSVSVGDAFACALSSDGEVFCWGDDSGGQLGNGHHVPQVEPVTEVVGPSDIVAIDSGSNSTCAVHASGGLTCWGLGFGPRGTLSRRSRPIDIPGVSDAVRVSVGELYSNGITYYGCAVTAKGGLACMFAPMGESPATSLADIPGLGSGVADVSIWPGNACVVMTTGGVRCWGNNDHGQLGDGTHAYSARPVDAVGLSSGVQAVATASNFTCALLTSGVVECWGWNRFYQLADGTTESRPRPGVADRLPPDIVSIAGGGEHMCATTSAGTNLCWGSNLYKALGVDTKLPR